MNATGRTAGVDRGLVLALVLTAAEPSSTPLRWVSEAMTVRLWYLGPLWGALALLALANPAVQRVAMHSPARWLVATGLWMMVTSPFGWVPHYDLLVAGGFTACALYGVSVVTTGGWAPVRDAVFWSSVILLVGSAATEAIGIGSDRWVGLFAEPNGLAFAAVVAALSGLDRWIRGGRGGLVLASGAVVVLVLTDGRVAMLSLAVGIVVRIRPALPRLVLPAVALVAAGGALFLATDASLGVGLSRAVSRSGEVSEIVTVTGRTSIWRAAIEQIADRPISGVGAGSTPEFYEAVARRGDLGFTVFHAHDLWLQLGLSGGVVAIGLVAIGAIAHVRRVRGGIVRDREALMLALLVHGLTEDVVGEPKATLVIAAAAFASTWVAAPHRADGIDRPSAARAALARAGSAQVTRVTQATQTA